MAGTGVGKFSSTASNNTSNLTVNFAENMAPSNVNNAARELMGHMRDMYEQLGDGYFEFGDGDGTYTVARGDADTITITSSADISGIYFAGRKIRITDGGANVVEGTIASSSHSSTTQTVNLTGISLASGTPTKVELGIDTAAFGGRIILDDDGDTYIEAPTDDTIDIYVAGAKDFVITANTFTAESGSTIAAQALTATSITSTGNIIIPNAGNIGSASDTDSIAIASDGVVTLTQKLIGTELDISGNIDVDGTTNLDVVDIDGAVDMASTLGVTGVVTANAGVVVDELTIDGDTITATDDFIIDAVGDITLDADGDNIRLNYGGTQIGQFKHDSSNLEIHTTVNNEDMIFKGIDNGSEITALTLDMSEAGQATFNQGIVLKSSAAGGFGVNISTASGDSMNLQIVDTGSSGAANGSINVTDGALILSTSGSERIRLLNGGTISTGGDTSPDVGAGGIGLNQGANDDNIFTLKSSDVAHGFTGVDDTDTYAGLKKFNINDGGLSIKGYSEDVRAVVIDSFVNATTTTEAVNAGGAVMIDTHKRSGTGTADLDADDNLFCVLMNNDTRFIVKGDGELFSDQSATVGTYDAYEDAQLVRAFDLNHMQGVINSKFDKFVQYNKDDLKKAKLIGTDDDGNATPFVNVTGMQRLHNGAIWQQYEKTERLANAMYELAKAAVGEEKANEILEQNEIKLLN